MDSKEFVPNVSNDVQPSTEESCGSCPFGKHDAVEVEYSCDDEEVEGPERRAWEEVFQKVMDSDPSLAAEVNGAAMYEALPTTTSYSSENSDCTNP